MATKAKPPFDKSEEEARRGLYVAYLEDFGRIGGRHETARAFYLSVITAVIGLLALAGPDGLFEKIQPKFLAAVAVLGMLISAAWFLHMFSFGTLFAAKRETLQELEKELISEPFTLESETRKGYFWYLRLTIVDRCVAAAFFLLFGYLLSGGSVPA